MQIPDLFNSERNNFILDRILVSRRCHQNIVKSSTLRRGYMFIEIPIYY